MCHCAVNERRKRESEAERGGKNQTETNVHPKREYIGSTGRLKIWEREGEWRRHGTTEGKNRRVTGVREMSGWGGEGKGVYSYQYRVGSKQGDGQGKRQKDEGGVKGERKWVGGK